MGEPAPAIFPPVAAAAVALAVVPRDGKRTPNRQRKHVMQLRADDTERAALESRASAAGLSVGAYLRACGLGDTGPRARRRAPVDRVLLATANADLNRVGNNINQIARLLNIAALDEAGSDLARQVAELDRPITAAITELSATLAAIRGALGYDRQG
jgi:hypothetical protein